MKTYHGSCHCGAIKYEADIDFSKGTAKCNCTICQKLRWWAITLKPNAFRLVSPSSASDSDAFTDYIIASPMIHNFFCKKCGVHAFHEGYHPQLGDFITVNVACLDDVEPRELIENPVRCVDGRNNNWLNPPQVTEHM